MQVGLFYGQPVLVQARQMMLLRLKRRGHCHVNCCRLCLGAHSTPVKLRGRSLAKFARPEGLGDVVVGAAGHTYAHVSAFLQRRQQDDGNRLYRTIIAKFLQHGEAIHDRHLYIADDEVWLVRTHQ